MFSLCILVTLYSTATMCRAAPLLQPIFHTNPWPNSPFLGYQQPYIIMPAIQLPGFSRMPMSPVPLSAMAIQNSVIKNSNTEKTIELKDLPVVKTDPQTDSEGKVPNKPQPMEVADFQSLAALLQMQNNAIAEVSMSQRWSVGDFINGISWLPIEVNVPDTVMGIYNGISAVVGGWAQRIPFINRITTGVTPRPLKFLTIGPDGKPYMVPFNVLPMSYDGIQSYLSYNNMMSQM